MLIIENESEMTIMGRKWNNIKEKKAQKSKRNLLKQINIEIYKRDDSAIWK